jgi:hypothetical protein
VGENHAVGFAVLLYRAAGNTDQYEKEKEMRGSGAIKSFNVSWRRRNEENNARAIKPESDSDNAVVSTEQCHSSESGCK